MPLRTFWKLFAGLVLISLSTSLFAQNGTLDKTLSLNIKKESIPEILKTIETKTGAMFSYNTGIIPDGRYSVFANDEKLNEILITLLQRHRLNFALLYGNVIVITKAPPEKELITLSGYVYDDSTGEKMIGASVYNFLTMKGTTTNEDGFYSLTLEKDSVWLVASYVGYKPAIERFYLDWHKRKNLHLSSGNELPGVIKSAGTDRSSTPILLPNEFRIPMRKFKNIPVLFGESDIIKLLQLLPGVQAGNEGTTGLYVRGGGPDQNLILLDDVPVYNASHIYGFFSVFNSDVVKNARLIKGGFPARYGGRLSSVLDIRTLDGNTNKLRAELSLGLISSKATLDGPLYKDKTTFVFSARRTYFDLLGGLVPSEAQIPGKEFSSNYYFYDINGKVNHKFDEKNSLSLSFYNGSDKSYIVNAFAIKNPNDFIREKDKQIVFWGNSLVSMRYSKLVNKKVFGQATVAYSNYRFGNKSDYSYNRTTDSGQVENTYEYRFLSQIQDLSLITDVDYRPAQFWTIRMGGNFIVHRFSPGVSTYRRSGTNNALASQKNEIVMANEFNAYAENDIAIRRNFTANIGLHYTVFNVQNTFDQSLQPRINLRYKIINHLSVSASYANMMQFLHLLTNATVGLPMDLWLPSTARIKPEYSNMATIGVLYAPKKWHYSIEAFNKNMNNVLEYKEQANYIANSDNWEDKVEVGRGWAYGTEFLIEKKTGKTTGWIGYTLSWNFRQFDNLNQGKVFPYRYDRRHDIGVLISHAFNEKIDLVATWVYATGNSISLPTQRYIAGSGINPMQDVYLFGDRNGYTLPAYHRLDLVCNFKKYSRKFSRIWSIGAYNVYNRQNPFYITTGFNKNGERTLQQVSIFPIIPSVNYKISF